MGVKHIIYLTATLMLLIGSISSAYIYTTTSDSENITIHNQTYSIDQLSLLAAQRTITIESTDYSGVALDELMINIGISNPESQTYTLIASDYQQTVEWEDLTTGVLTEERRSIFADLPKKFWVRNIIEIEVT